MKKTSRLKILVFVLMILLTINQAIGNQTIQETISRDVFVEILLQQEIRSNQTYESFIRLENKDHIGGNTDALELQVIYNITNQNNKTKTYNYTRQINRFSNAGATLELNSSGIKKLCVKAIPQNFIDTNLSNNQKCKYLYVDVPKPEHKKEEYEEENLQQKCGCNFNIQTDKKIYETGEQIRFQIDFCTQQSSTYTTPITYWIEDANSNIIRNKINTTSTATKTYTPRIETTHIIKAKANECGIETKKLIGIKREEKQEQLELQVPTTTNDQTALLINLKGFKKDNTKNSISLWLEKNSQRITPITRTNVRGNFVDIDLTLPLYIPELQSGMYEVVMEGLDVKKSQRIYVEGREKETSSQTTQSKTKIRTFNTRKQIFDGSLMTTLTLTQTDEVLVKIIS